MNFVFVTIKWSVNMGVAGVIVKCKIPTVRKPLWVVKSSLS